MKGLPAEQPPPTPAPAPKYWGRRRAAAPIEPASLGKTPAAAAALAPPLDPPGLVHLLPLDSASVQIAFCACGVVTALFLMSHEDLVHWFVIPVYLCGVVTSLDAIDWCRGRVSVVDPGGILGLIGIHFFFLAPLLHVVWDWWLPYAVHPPDWRPWLGYMAMLNLAGLLVYRFVRDLPQLGRRADSRTEWIVHMPRMVPLLGAAMAVSVALQLWIYFRFGGISGYVAAYQTRVHMESFKGMGGVFAIAEMFPVLCAIAYVLYARRTARASDWFSICVVLLVLFILKIFFGGLRGSRANYIWPMFWAVAIVHLWVREIPRRFIGIGLVCGLFFMYAYSVYKTLGAKAADALVQPSALNDMARDARRGIDAMILGDLGRSDVQSYILREVASSEGRGDFSYAWGRTYLGAAALLVPSAIWPDRPASKVREGTEILFGSGTWDTRHFTASSAYGLGGEAMMNFGPVAVPLAYGVLGWVVGWVRRWMYGLSHRDSRKLLVPFVVSLMIYLLVWDSDVIIFYIVTTGIAPAAIVWAGSVRGRRGTDLG